MPALTTENLRPLSRGEGAGKWGGWLRWQLVVLLGAAALALFARFFRADTFGFFEDDFFYYVVAARHFAQQGVSTFDGVHLTNGYHPLWFLLLAGLLRVTAGRAFLVAVQVVATGALVGFYVALERLLERLGVRRDVCANLALALSLHALLLFRYGMEVTLALPLGVAALAWCLGPRFAWTARQTVVYGLLAALTVLARIDALLLFALVLGLQTVLADVAWRTRAARVGWFAVGMAPVLLYLAVNHHVFGAWLPVSGAAKHMKPLWPLSPVPVIALFVPVDRMKMAFVAPAVVLLVVGWGRLVAVGRSFERRRLAVVLAMMLFPVAQMAWLSALSDWSLWPWYFYTLVFATVGAVVVLLTPKDEAREIVPGTLARGLMVAAMVFYAVYVSVYSVKKHPSTIAMLASDVSGYMRAHPATYAMGDEAGTTAYLSGQPIVQLEGLMMDKAFLANIRERRPLGEVLRSYGVRYYVVLYAKPVGGCYHMAVPANGGPASPHMQGTICSAPLFSAVREGKPVSVFDVNDVR